MSEPADATRTEVYRVRARNTATASENRIHDDQTAARFGFRGGLVPGVTVYGYLTVPVVARFGQAWLEGGAMQVRFFQPVYEGDDVIVKAEAGASADEAISSTLALTAERDDGSVCAVATATLNASSVEPRLADYPLAPLPASEARPIAARDSFIVGAALGTLRETLNLKDTSRLDALDERLAVYRGDEPLAHPVQLLELSNHLLMRNFKLGPWLHAASELVNYSAARDGEVIETRGRITDCFERKGHEFVVCDVLLVANGSRLVQRVRHTAIYRPRFV
jgi:acyl dehydratase